MLGDVALPPVLNDDGAPRRSTLMGIVLALAAVGAAWYAWMRLRSSAPVSTYSCSIKDGMPVCVLDAHGTLSKESCTSSCGGSTPPSDKYACNAATGTCSIDPKGTMTKEACVASCTAAKYSCKNKQCVQDPRGTMSLQQCASSPACKADLYRCDATSGQCVQDNAMGTMTQNVCSQSCTMQTLYKCNTATGQCEASKSGTPDQAQCNSTCTSFTPDQKYSCNATNHTCERDASGSMEVDDCLQSCSSGGGKQVCPSPPSPPPPAAIVWGSDINYQPQTEQCNVAAGLKGTDYSTHPAVVAAYWDYGAPDGCKNDMSIFWQYLEPAFSGNLTHLIFAWWKDPSSGASDVAQGVIEALNNGSTAGPSTCVWDLSHCEQGASDIAGVCTQCTDQTSPCPQYCTASPTDGCSMDALRSRSGKTALVVAAFGAVYTPMAQGLDPETAATSVAQWVFDNKMDGVDIDHEESKYYQMTASDPQYSSQASEWLCKLTTKLRDIFDQHGDPPCKKLGGPSRYVISHAPQAPYFNSDFNCTYRDIDAHVGDKIDFYNVQFYNQNGSAYDNWTSLACRSAYATCSKPATRKCDYDQCASVYELASPTTTPSIVPVGATFKPSTKYTGIPLHRIVIGKPLMCTDERCDINSANTGTVDAALLQTMLYDMQQIAKPRGAMVWQYHGLKWVDQFKAWMDAVGNGLGINGKAVRLPYDL